MSDEPSSKRRNSPEDSRDTVLSPVLYIVGTDHRTQYVYDRDEVNEERHVEEFGAYLRREATRLNVNLLAEELSEEAIAKEAIAKNAAVVSNARRIAKSLGARHIFCDPDSAQRRALGIPSEQEIKKQLGLGSILNHCELSRLDDEQRKYWPQRESFWYNHTKDELHTIAMFVCGKDHARRFEKLVGENGHQAQILIENWYEEVNR